MLTFSNKVLLIGFGGVARCTLPILRQTSQRRPHAHHHYGLRPGRGGAEALDRAGRDLRQGSRSAGQPGESAGPVSLAGDLLIDLAWNIDCCEIVQWCHDRGVLYINTSVELWDPYAGAADKHPTERTLYWRHMKLRRHDRSWSEPGPTAVIEHGANPGLISHFTKQALLDIADRALADKKFARAAGGEDRHHAKAREFNHLAHQLGVKVIHCSERDTQITNRPKEVNEFVNTWSVEGFREEGTTTAEMGWGTHEKELPRFRLRASRRARRARSAWRGWESTPSSPAGSRRITTSSA